MSDQRYGRRLGPWLALAWAGSLLMVLPGCGDAPMDPQATAKEGAATVQVDNRVGGSGEVAVRPAADDPSGPAEADTHAAGDGPQTTDDGTASDEPNQGTDPNVGAEPGDDAPALESQATSGDPDPAIGPEAGDDPADLEYPFPHHIKAPPLTGGVGWINTAGPIDIEDLKGKFVILDFWTYCCINCMHVLPELKKLERAYPNNLVVIGVHSAKFETEEDSENITDAVMRYDIEHPVVNDAQHVIWGNYFVSSWPSLRIIDPEGNLVAIHSAEIEFETLDEFLKSALPYYRKKGLLDETPLRFDLAAFDSKQTPLRYPGKLLADEATDRLFISDSSHNRLVVARLDGTLLETIGSGQLGKEDGDYATATFNHPQGMALDGDSLYVADTENHLIRRVDLKEGRVTTVAGVGRQNREGWPGLDLNAIDERTGQIALPKRWVGPPLLTALNSPWDVWVKGRDLFIAMAGPHQIWRLSLDENTPEIGPYAGNNREDIVDGPLLPSRPGEAGFASFAQPSGLTSDGEWLYVADSEGSSVRAVPFDPAGEVRTVVGTSHLPEGRLFTFGDVDGKGASVRFQHCLGVAFHDGALYVADTYNNKVKVINLGDQSVKTLAGSRKPGRTDDPPAFDEPAGLSYAAGKLYVADTNNHLIRVVDLEQGNAVSTLEIAGLAPPVQPEPQSKPRFADAEQVQVEAQVVRASDNTLRLAVTLELPDGYKINDKAPMAYVVEAAEGTGPVDRAAIGQPVKLKPPAADFEVTVPLTAAEGSDTLQLGLTYYYCQDGAGGLCKVGTVQWTVPVKLSADAEQDAVPLRLKLSQ